MTSLKESLTKQLESSLAKWKAEIDEVTAKAKAEEADAEARRARADLEKELWSRVEQLKTKAEDAERRLAELRESTEEEAGRIRDEVLRLVA